MSRNGSGTYSLPAGNPVVTGTTISSTWANNTLTDIATALTGSLAADGQTTATGNLKMGANRITGLADGIAATDAATVSQITSAGTTYLLKASNLSDVANAATSRTNLGLGTIATQAANSVAVTGGAIDGTTIGTTAPSTVKTTGLTVTGSTSGTLAIAATAIAGTNTATFPAATGTVMVSGNMPVFSAYLSANQSVSSGVFTKVQCNTEEFDTASAYDNATNYRFTPLVAGYYQVNARIDCGTSSISNAIISIYKNGSESKRGNQVTATSGEIGIVVSSIIYLNGSTDYIELYGTVTGTTPLFYGGNAYATYFQASMIRSA
jgi:hypothetical protein